MPARLWNYVVLITVMVTTSGTLMLSFAQAKDPMPTFELDRIIEMALERNPAIATARSVIEQNEGGQIQAGAYPNPLITAQSADAAIRDPSNGIRIIERGVTVHQTVEWPGMRAARQDAAAAGLVGAGLAGFSNGIALLTRREESMIAVANFISLPLLFFSSILIARNLIPAWMRSLSLANPVEWAVRAARGHVLPGTSWGQIGLYLGLLAVFTAATGMFATRCFSAYQRTL